MSEMTELPILDDPSLNAYLGFVIDRTECVPVEDE